MFPLDDRTAERLAEVIVDIGGPYERKSYQLEQLLQRCGWADPPEYDGGPRIAWLAEQLIERRDQRGDVERLLCRVCDPLEYDDGMVSAEEFRLAVNAKLEAERLVVSYIGGRPVVGELGSDGRRTVFSAPEDLDRRLRRLIRDPEAVDLLMNRVNETLLCEESTRWRSSASAASSKDCSTRCSPNATPRSGNTVSWAGRAGDSKWTAPDWN